MSLKSGIYVFFIFMVGFCASTAHAFDLDYVTGGSINLGFGTSAIQYRRGVSDTDHAIYLTFGGPSIKLSFPDIDFTVLASFFPSLRYLDGVDSGTNHVGVVLGFGPSFGYKSWLVSLPVYFPGPSQTDVAIAVGYRL